MLKYTDDLNAVMEALKRGEVAAEDVHTHLASRLEFTPEAETRRLLNDLEVAVYSLPEPSRQVRIFEILAEAAGVAASHPPPDAGET